MTDEKNVMDEEGVMRPSARYGELYDLSPNLLYKTFYELSHENTWSGWKDYATSSRGQRGIPVKIDELGAVTVTVEVPATPGSGCVDTSTLLFCVKNGTGDAERWYSMTGLMDSYGETRWRGRFIEVRPVRKEITVYEPV